MVPSNFYLQCLWNGQWVGLLQTFVLHPSNSTFRINMLYALGHLVLCLCILEWNTVIFKYNFLKIAVKVSKVAHKIFYLIWLKLYFYEELWVWCVLELYKTALWFPGDLGKLFNSWILKFYFPFQKGKTHLKLSGFSDFEIKPLYRTITALLIHVEAKARWSKLQLYVYRSHFSSYWHVNYYVREKL